MRNVLLGIVGIVDLAANFPYIRDCLKSKTKPNLASWSTWSLINGIAAIAALAAGNAFNTVLLGLSYFAGSFTILLIAIFKGTRKYTRLDACCQAIAILGIVLWCLSHDPKIAIVFAIVADVCAVIPTIYHAYYHPHEETWETFAIASAGAFAFLCLAPSLTFAALAVPMDFFLANTLITLVIILRGRVLRAKDDRD